MRVGIYAGSATIGCYEYGVAVGGVAESLWRCYVGAVSGAEDMAKT